MSLATERHGDWPPGFPQLPMCVHLIEAARGDYAGRMVLGLGGVDNGVAPTRDRKRRTMILRWFAVATRMAVESGLMTRFVGHSLGHIHCGRSQPA